MNREVATQLLSRVGWPADRPDDFRGALLQAAKWRQGPAGAPVTLGGEEASKVIGPGEGIVGITAAMGAADTPMMTIFYPGS